MQGIKTDAELSHKTYVNVVKPRRRVCYSAKVFLVFVLTLNSFTPSRKGKDLQQR